MPPLVAGYPPPPAVVHDPEAARAALAAAGGAAAIGRLELLFPSTELNRDVAEVLQQQWRAVLGLEVRLVNQESRTFAVAQSELDYQISRSSWIGDYFDPLTFLEIFTTGHRANRTGWSDPDYDALLDRAAAAADAGERFRLLAAAEERLLAAAPIVPLMLEVGLELVAPRLQGFTRNARGYVDWGRLAVQPERRP